MHTTVSATSPQPARTMSRRWSGVLAWRRLHLRRETFEKRPWLVSLLFHLIILGIMACIVIDRHGRFDDDSLFAILDTGNEEELVLDLVNPEFKEELPENASSDNQILDQMLLEEMERVDQKVPTPEVKVDGPNIPDEDIAEQSKEDAATEKQMKRSRKSTRQDSKQRGKKSNSPTIQFTDPTPGRSGPGKQRLLQQFGGTAETEAAVDRGLKWLIRQQQDDGSWSLSGPYVDGMPSVDNREAATSMALLAFLGAGHTHHSGDYQKQIDKAWHWLVYQQSKNGAFGSDAPHHHRFYTHAQATLALSEGYLMTQDPWLKNVAQKAASYAVKAQGLEGGWRYDFRGDSDTSVTGWMLMALVSGRAAYLEIPESTFSKVSNWLDLVQREDGEMYSYTPYRPPSMSMTAEGLLCRMYLGWPRTNPAINRSVDRLLDVGMFRSDTPSYYYWYYATQVMHHAGGERWKKWNDVMRVELPAMQVKAGPETGSWSPASNGGFDLSAGRLYSTCLAMYCLEVYYRHMPIYDSPWGENEPIKSEVAKPVQ